MSPAELEDRLIEFASRIISVSETLPSRFGPNYLGKQLFRSGTSPALNYGEAQEAESTNDFIHKMKVCLKELKETLICLKIICRSKLIDLPMLEPLMKENNELIAIFISSIKTARNKKAK